MILFTSLLETEAGINQDGCFRPPRRLIVNLDRHLHCAIAAGSRDHTKRRRAIHGQPWSSPRRMVESVERFHAELGVKPLFQLEVLEDGEIQSNSFDKIRNLLERYTSFTSDVKNHPDYFINETTLRKNILKIFQNSF